MTTKTVKSSPKAKAVVKSAELVVTDKEITYAEIWSFIQEHAGGNEANVKIVPLDNVDTESAVPVPFGYGGRPGGVRQKIQDWMLKGVDGDTSDEFLKTLSLEDKTAIFTEMQNRYLVGEGKASK